MKKKKFGSQKTNITEEFGEVFCNVCLPFSLNESAFTKEFINTHILTKG